MGATASAAPSAPRRKAEVQSTWAVEAKAVLTTKRARTMIDSVSTALANVVAAIVAGATAIKDASRVTVADGLGRMAPEAVDAARSTRAAKNASAAPAGGDLRHDESQPAFALARPITCRVYLLFEK